jgi:hypothetical protein
MRTRWWIWVTPRELRKSRIVAKNVIRRIEQLVID